MRIFQENFFLNLFYVATPWALYFLYKCRKNFVNKELFKLLSLILGFMFLIFFLVALKNELGIHWFILFVPYFFLLFSFLDDSYLKKLFTYNSIFTFIHIVVILSALIALKTLPTSYLSKSYFYPDMLFADENKVVCANIETTENLFALGYTNASLLSYFCKKDIMMLFNDSKFGRFDDVLTDIRELDGENVHLFNNRIIKTKELDNVCSKVTIDTFSIKNIPFYLATCTGFNYQKYKNIHLQKQKDEFYTIPKWLPRGECYFDERYTFNESIK